MRDFTKATGRLAKTDALDLAVLAHFAEAVRLPLRPLRDAETQDLNSMVARRQQAMTMLVAERNRLSSAAIAVRPRIEAHILWLKHESDDLDQGLRQTIRQSPVWREKDDLLRSVPGIGDQISLTPNPPKRCALALTPVMMGKGRRTGQVRYQQMAMRAA